MKAPRILAAVFVSGAAAACLAGPLNKAWVAPDATWVVHVDVDAAKASTLGAFITEHSATVDLKDLDTFREETGVDPRRDIKGITVYGSGSTAEDFVAIVSSTPAVDGLFEKLNTGKQKLERFEESGRTLYKWTERGSERYGYLKQGAGEERTVVASPDKSRLLAAISQLEEGAPTRAEGALAPSPHEGSILFVSGTSMGGLHDPQCSMMLQKAEGVVVDMGERAGDVYADITVATHTSEDATNLLQMAQGAIAVAKMLHQSEPDLKPLLKLSSSLTMQAEGKSVSAHLRCTSAQFRELLTSSLDEHDARTKLGISAEAASTTTREESRGEKAPAPKK